MSFKYTFNRLAIAASFLFISFSVIAEPTLEEVVVSVSVQKIKVVMGSRNQ